MEEDRSSPEAVDALTQQDSIQDMVFVLFETTEETTPPIQIFLPFDRHVPVYVAKQLFQLQFAAQYSFEHAQSIEWHTVLVHDLNSDQRVTLSEIVESMSLEDLRQTQNTPDGRDYSLLLVIMPFSLTVLEDPRFQHSHPVTDFVEVKPDHRLKKPFSTIMRNVLVAIDSSIGPLSQSEFPNYNKRPGKIMPQDISRFMMKTVGSYKSQENLELHLKDILFRPSWFSLLSHILFNSQQIVRICRENDVKSMVHIVTGSSGIGKSALRFPAITLALSLGAEEVCTAKAGEYPLRFVRKRSKKSQQSTSISTHAPRLTPNSIPSAATFQGGVKRNTPSEENGSSQKVKTENPNPFFIPHPIPFSPPHSNPFFTPHPIPFSPPHSKQLSRQFSLVLKSRTTQSKGNHSLDSEASRQLSADTSTPPAKQLTMHVTHVNKPPRDIPITPTIHKYDVFVYDARVESSSDQEKKYGKDLFPKEKKFKLGEVEVPSIHHFPHFLRLFVDRNNKIQNPLEDKTWHIVDDLVLAPGKLNPSQHYVLLTSPNRSRWELLLEDGVQPPPLVLYVSPRYTLFEEINMLNAIPCPIKTTPRYQREKLAQLKEVVEILGFTPRNLQNFTTQYTVLDKLFNEPSKANVSGDAFGDKIAHKLIVLDSPQADPHNFTMAYASPKAKEILAQKWTEYVRSKYNAFMEVPDTPVSHTDLADPMLPMLFQRLTHSSIRLGAQFSKIKYLDGTIVEADANMLLSFPPTPTRSAVDSSGICNAHHAFLPDMAEFRCLDRNIFNEGLWNQFFVCCMIDEHFGSEPVEPMDEKSVSKMKEPTTPLEGMEVDSDESASSSEAPVAGEPEPPIPLEQPHKSGYTLRPRKEVSYTDKSKSRPSKRERTKHITLHYYTFHLVPLGQCNADFDSILLFFRVIPSPDTDQPPKIDSLSVHFLKSSIGCGEEIDEVGANAMMAWLVLLMDLYELRADQIFPHFVFVVSESVFPIFSAKTRNITSFIPEDNIVIAALTSQTGNLRDLTIETVDELLLDTGKRLPPNNDAMCVRCGFCGEVIGDNFNDHVCVESYDGWSNLDFHKQLLDPLKASNRFVQMPEWWEKLDRSEKDLVTRADPPFLYKRKTLAERLSNRRLPCSDQDSDANMVGLPMKYPWPNATIPNTKQAGNYFTPLPMNVTMVPPLDAFSEQDEKQKQDPRQTSPAGENGMTVKDIRETLLNDSFGDSEKEKSNSMTITVSSRQPLPPPCHLYRTPFYTQPLRTYPTLTELLKIKPFSAGGPMTDEEMEIAKLLSNESPRRGKLSHTNASTTRMANLMEIWMAGFMIVLDKRGDTYFGTQGTYMPHTNLKCEEPSSVLIDSDECLGQMMLPFEHVGELRERIRRLSSVLFPFSILRPHPRPATPRPQPMMEQCLLVIQQELELFWQMLSLPNMTEPDFDSSFGFSFALLEWILRKMESFIQYVCTLMKNGRKVVNPLLSKLAVVKARLSDVGKDRVSAFDVNILNTINHINVLNEVRYQYELEIWKDNHPKINDEILEQQVIEKEKELKELDTFVFRHLYEKNETEFIKNRNTIAWYNQECLRKAWSLYHFFGSLVMTLPVGAGTQYTLKGLIPYQPMENQEWKDRKNEDVMKAMQYVSSIVGYLEYTRYQILKDKSESHDQYEEEEQQYFKILKDLWEYFSLSFRETFLPDIESYQETSQVSKVVIPPHLQVAQRKTFGLVSTVSISPHQQVALKNPFRSQSTGLSPSLHQDAQQNTFRSQSIVFNPPTWRVRPNCFSTSNLPKKKYKTSHN
ncbi:hypothetical protein BLNAU_7727 [Blattamonas nauphoetae]|uniref:EF-hand domain-containing protein n=1 Tax=Blattamonas nauphoetae TaxID=2049346 RepID=A0ABQ9Y0X9_9EUKA|nr:hypothetical protein BLNAU_7727 [Blattamonas nauphoetae]